MRKTGMVSATSDGRRGGPSTAAKPPTRTGSNGGMEAAKSGEAESRPERTGDRERDDGSGRTEIEAQKAKWMPNYDKAKEMIAQAKTQADAAKEAAIAGKEKAKNEATQAIADAKMMVAGAEAGLKTAPKGKGTKADLEMMGKDIEGYKQSITDAEGLMTSEDYMGARDKAKAAMDGAKGVQDQIVAAGGKIPEAKPADMAPPAAAEATK